MIGTVAVLIGATSTISLAASDPAEAASTCSVNYRITSQWPDGFGTDIVLTNNTPTNLTTWTLTWSFANGQTIYQHWGTDLDQNGAAVTATSEPNEGFIAAGGGTFHLGFLGRWNGTNAAPTDFALDGKPCTLGAGGGTGGGTAPATKAPAKPGASPAATTRPTVSRPAPAPAPKASTGTPAAAPAANLPAGATCAAIYEIETQWPAGNHRSFLGDIQIVNLTPKTLTSWTFGWTFPNDQTIYQSWGADFHQSGRRVTAKSEPNEGWLNGNGGRFHLGFLGNVTSANAVPTSFTFNGKTCPLVDDALKPLAPAAAATSPAPAAPPTTAPRPGTMPAAVASCQAIYEIETSWPTSTGRAFLADVQLVNTTPKVLTTWRFEWTFAGNQSIYQSWGADFAQSGKHVSAASEPNEGYVAANGGTFHMGFLANYTGTNDVAARFMLNGTPCTLVKG